MSLHENGSISLKHELKVKSVALIIIHSILKNKSTTSTTKR